MRHAARGTLVVLGALLLPLVGVAPAALAERTPGLSEARRRATETTRQLQQLENELGALDADVRRLESERVDAEGRLERLRARVRHVAIERYTSSGSELALQLGADINEQERARALARIVTQSDADAIDEYRAAKARLERASVELAERRAAQQSRLAAMQRQREKLDQELAELEREEAERIEAERRAAQEAARRAAAEPAPTATPKGPSTTVGSPGPSATTTTTTPRRSGPAPSAPPGSPTAGGGWICPVQGARTFVDSWGAPRPGGRAHQGVDIMAPRGTPVVIPVSGVVQLKTGGIGGLTFRLQGDDGNWYYGAHLDAYAGPQGRLPAGTVVGYVGDTGDARGTGTHLHFEIHLGGYGNPVNPYPTVARYC